MAEIQGPMSVLSWALETLETYFSYSILVPTSRWAWVLISLWQLDGNLLKIQKKKKNEDGTDLCKTTWSLTKNTVLLNYLKDKQKQFDHAQKEYLFTRLEK